MVCEQTLKPTPISKQEVWCHDYYGVKRIGVRHFSQINRSACGAACLQMVYDHFGVDIPQKQIWQEVRYKKRNWATTYALARHAHKNDLKTFTGRLDLKGELSDLESIDQFLERTIAKLAIPLIILWRRPESDNGHYSVVSGKGGSRLEILDPLNTAGSAYLLHSMEYLHAFWQPHQQLRGGIFLAVYPKDQLAKFPFKEGQRILKNF